MVKRSFVIKTDKKCFEQKGVDNNKIFELRAETRTERSFGCQMTIAKEKSGCSAKSATRRSPKPVKIVIFEAVRKNRKIAS